MTKHLIAAAVAAALWVPEAAAQSILQKSDWQPKTFESYLPAPPIAVPWLDLDSRTKLPKGDWPIGWQANAVPPLVLPHTLPNPQVSSTATFDVRRM